MTGVSLSSSLVAESNDTNDINVIICSIDMATSIYLDCIESPRIENGYTLVPLRSVSESLGCDVGWNDSGKIQIKKDNRMIELTLGQTSAVVEGQVVEMPIAPKVIHETTMIPLRFLLETFNQYVEWQKLSDGKNYVWISPLPLLKKEDYKITNKYYHDNTTDYPTYILKEGCHTYRGLGLGDSRNDVIKLYGNPHQIKHLADDINILLYFGITLPDTDFGPFVRVTIKNDTVVQIDIGAL